MVRSTIKKNNTAYKEGYLLPWSRDAEQVRGCRVSRHRWSNICKRKGSNKKHSDDDQESDDNKDSDLHTSIRSTRKRKRLMRFEVTEIIVKKNMKLLEELQALANQQKKEGKTDLVESLVNCLPRAVTDILNTAWEIENAADNWHDVR